MKPLYLGIFLILTSACKGISEEQLSHLNGYWEIASVTTSQGSTREYTVSTTIDYIELTDSLKGYRKKVQPNFDGTYVTNDDAEYFSIEKLDKTYYMHYQNEMAEWQEVLEVVGENEFRTRNDSGNTYTYRRYQPININ